MNDRSFVKLFSSILASSLWSEDSDTRVVWVTLMALANAHGEVIASMPGLARIANVPMDRCETAMSKFLAPDPNSRNPAFDGRRLEAIQGGWKLLSYEFYKRLASEEQTREYNRAYHLSRNESRPVKKVQGSSRISRQAEAEAEVEANKEKEGNGAAAPSTLALEASESGKPQNSEASEPSRSHVDASRGPKAGPSRARGTLEECKAFAVELGLPASDGEAFYWGKEGTGWVKVKDWRATIRNWKAQGWLASQRGNGGSQKHFSRTAVAGGNF